MQDALVDLLQDPVSGEGVQLSVFETSANAVGEMSIIEGILYSKSGAAFPIIRGVPVMIPSAFPPAFLNKHRDAIRKIAQTIPLQLGSGAAEDFSFSAQWERYFGDGVERMWGWTLEERLEQLLMEMQVDRGWFRGKTVLDAGCGPGDLSEAIAALGANVVAIDYSSSVFRAEQRRRTRSLHLVRSDVANAGLKCEIFDAVLSLGVVMFTPDPARSFAEICRLVKPGGRFYINLDRFQENFVARYIVHPPLDLARRAVSRLPARPQLAAVKMWATLMAGVDGIRRGRAKASRGEYLMSAYNFMTPRWRHYHTAYELAGWFYKNGFGPPVLSHWDNPYAFGLMAIKRKQNATPGIHFGKAPKLWDKSGALSSV